MKRDLNAIRSSCPRAFIPRRPPPMTAVKSQVGKVRFYHKNVVDPTSCKPGTVCWYCTEPFQKLYQCPRFHDHCTDTYVMEGCFCSYSCAKAYAIETMDRGRTSENACTYIDRIARLHGHKEPVQRSPHWSCLEKFGGYMTIDAFRNCAPHDIPTTVPPASRLVQGGFCSYLYDKADPVPRYDKLKGLPEAPTPQADSDMAAMPLHTPVVPTKPVLFPPPKPVSVNSGKFQKEIKKRQVSYALQRTKKDSANAARNMQNLMGIKKVDT